ncbi:Tn3 family transposase [Nocardiopsis synnemataformans]|uniref:Tn3 family transposase n=1 Tax=Nocardiopsis synnemataformans TaxID=61305 RepID=UPI003EB87E78
MRRSRRITTGSSRACNIGLNLVAKPGVAALTRGRLQQHARAAPKYFGLRKRGATWLNVVNDQAMGLGGLVVPGTVRDSLFILDALHTRDGGPKPEEACAGPIPGSDVFRCRAWLAGWPRPCCSGSGVCGRVRRPGRRCGRVRR